MTSSRLERIGAGRSAEVFLDYDDQGREIVRKIFTGDPLSKAVLFVLTGSANPYTWCEPAMATGVVRRRVLARLVTFWFDDRIRLPEGHGWGWDTEHRAFEMRTELIKGRHVPLRGPDAGAVDPLPELVREVMRPLQGHLAEAGLDGLVWQAGRGNPVAANNFMLEETANSHSWVWIDLESGVPALFAMNPLATLGYYLPRSWHHRRWLFDDVDVPVLRRYLAERTEALEAALGPGAVDHLNHDVDELEAHQEAWRSIPRHVRGIDYERSQGRLSIDEAEYYRQRPGRWFLRLATVHLPRLVLQRLPRMLGRLWRRLRPYLRFRRLVRAGWLLLMSQRYRTHISHRLVLLRLRAWRQRRFLDIDESRELRRQLRDQEVSVYLKDFGMHIVIKPFIKAFQWFAVPVLLASGVLDVTVTALLLVFGGPMGRTLYTGGRFVQALAKRLRPPWIALLIGLLPVVGNTAYPAQLVYCSTESTGGVARFILYDTLAAAGRSVPIWGGSDSLTEHVMNRLGDWTIRLL